MFDEKERTQLGCVWVSYRVLRDQDSYDRAGQELFVDRMLVPESGLDYAAVYQWLRGPMLPYGFLRKIDSPERRQTREDLRDAAEFIVATDDCGSYHLKLAQRLREYADA
jgi:hypothetical protein